MPAPMCSWSSTVVALALGALIGCVDGERGDGAVSDPEKSDTGGIAEATAEALGVLRVANSATVDELERVAKLEARAADNIGAYRLGDDREPATMDDEQFESLAELDAVPYVDGRAFRALLAYAQDRGFVVEGKVFPAKIWMNSVFISTHVGVGAAVEGYDTATFSWEKFDRPSEVSAMVSPEGRFQIHYAGRAITPSNGDRILARFTGPSAAPVGCSFSYHYDGGAVYSLAEMGCTIAPLDVSTP